MGLSTVNNHALKEIKAIQDLNFNGPKIAEILKHNDHLWAGIKFDPALGYLWILPARHYEYQAISMAANQLGATEVDWVVENVLIGVRWDQWESDG